MVVLSMFTQAEIASYYSRMEIETSASPRIIWILHAKSVQILRQARATPDLIKQRNQLNVVQNILAQLETSLKVNDELSQGLFYLYDYCYCLLETEEENKHAIALNILTMFRDTFRILLRK